jgi:hypothetical protein
MTIPSESDDELDGICDPDLQPTPIRDDDINDVVLYSDLNLTDDKAIIKRNHEWKELFPDAS